MGFGWGMLAMRETTEPCRLYLMVLVLFLQVISWDSFIYIADLLVGEYNY